ncbi:TraR/DksA C4-type zinc finger protein [Microbacterium sp.]|uniref:TraR/DksA family transcriptional regulator n=1 Tax=Microbacterium sp. TaxID=51671 RepID=UPI0028123FA9|nr:TraR/DksA C4-type zinc finger protein [Microbacterium sp.]
MPDPIESARELLLGRRSDAARRLTARANDLSSVAAARGDATADDEHDPEGSTLSGEWSHLTALSDAARLELREIDAALARLETGAYGVCESCGSEIPEGRLRARPTATRCVRCAA